MQIKKDYKSKLAGLMAIIMILTLLPSGITIPVFAETLASYTITLVCPGHDLSGATVTLTDTNDGSKSFSDVADENNIVTFEDKLEVGAEYELVVDPIVGYEDVSSENITIAAETNYDVTVNAINVVQVSGSIIDENGDPFTDDVVVTYSNYDNGTASVENGDYTFNAYDGKSYTITITPDDAKYETVSFDITAGDTISDKTIKVKKYDIDTSVNGANGVITASILDVEYGENKAVTATADAGYLIQSFKVNGDEQPAAVGVSTYTYNINSIDKDYTIEVAFVPTYDVTIVPPSNGTVTFDTGYFSPVTEGSDVKIVITPNDGYYISSIQVNNVEYAVSVSNSTYNEETDSLTVTVNITEASEINVSFTKKTITSKDNYTITQDTGTFYYASASKITYAAPDSTVTINKPSGTSDVQSIKVYCILYNNNSKPFTGLPVPITFGTTKNKVLKITGVSTASEKVLGLLGWSYGSESEEKIYCDYTAPTISTINNAGFVFSATTANSSKYTFTVTDAESGVKSVTYNTTNDATTATTLTATSGTYSIPVPTTETDTTYYIFVTDNVGNTANKNFKVIVDTTAPTVTGFEFTSNNVIYHETATMAKADITLKVTAADAGTVTSGVDEITLNIGDKPYTEKCTAGVATFTVKGSDVDFSTAQPISATAKDKAGNVTETAIKPSDLTLENIKSDNLIINTATPAVTITPDSATYTEGSGDTAKLWYDADVDLTAVITDDIIGIKGVTAKIGGQALAVDSQDTDITANFAGTDNSTFTDELAFVFNTAQLTSHGDGEISLFVEAENNVSTKGSATSTVYIDTTAPKITDYAIEKHQTAMDKILNFLTFGIFGNGKVQITITADDGAGSGVKSIVLYEGQEVIDQDDVDENNQVILEIDPSIALEDICAKAIDNVGNVTETAVGPNDITDIVSGDEKYPSNNLMLETDVPTIEFDYDAEVYEEDENTLWYNSDVEFNITVKDEQEESPNSGIASVEIKINDEVITSEDYTQENAATYEEEFTINTSQGTIAEDGSYTISVKVVDNAGNEQTETRKVYKDISIPTIDKIEFNAEEYLEGKTIRDVEETDYGFYFKAATSVTAYSSDAEPSSGIYAIEYYLDDINDGIVKSEIVPVDEDNKITIEVPANFKGQIYFSPIDNVTNQPKDGDKVIYTTPDGTIAETQDEHDTASHFALDVPTTKTFTSTGVNLYASNTDIGLVVTDTYSGIRSIEWSVVAPNDTDNNYSGSISIDNAGVVNGSSDGWKVEETENNIVTEVSKTFTIKNNSNDIVLTIKMTDRSGNTSETSTVISIDKTKPTISVSYDNNSIDSGEYFKANRTATIVVKERNFDPDAVAVNITNTDGKIPSISAWKEVVDTKNPDNNTYTATVKYVADGDYTFDINCTDMAGNISPNETYAKDTQPKDPTAFTIDKVKPVITVKYDNNKALNGNYYDAERTATITIVEHNFDASRVNISLSATNDGATIKVPSLSAWKTTGDTHVATIKYSADAYYVFDIECTDKAGNKADDYKEEDFYVDTIAPEISITNIVENSANNGTVAPVVSLSDTNFDRDNVKIELKGANRGIVELKGAYSDIHNGQTFTFADFERIEEVDDIYTLTATLTDKAGNETTETITFSVNRFGSTYAFGDKDSEKLNGTFSKTPIDIVVVETNPTALSNIKVTLFKNSDTKVLKEGKDYSVEVTGGNGNWYHYTYTIFEKAFKEDGAYRILFHSEDEAGNIAENTLDTKEFNVSFGIDNTNPIVVMTNLESKETYDTDKLTVVMSISDNLSLSKVVVYLDDMETPYQTWDEEAVKAIVKDNDGKFEFDIDGDSTAKHNVKVVAYDAAGNEIETEISSFYVTTNGWVNFYTNTWLLVGTILAAAAVIVFIVVAVRKKKKGSSK